MSVVIKDNYYVVHVPWDRYNTRWNEIGATAIEFFGLPGDKFSVNMTEDGMNFCFSEEPNAIFFSLKCL